MGDESKRTLDETWPFALRPEGHTFVHGGHRSFTTSPTGYAPDTQKQLSVIKTELLREPDAGVLAA